MYIILYHNYMYYNCRRRIRTAPAACGPGRASARSRRASRRPPPLLRTEQNTPPPGIFRPRVQVSRV